MVSTIGVPIVDYIMATKNQAQYLAQFQKTPSYAQAVAHYRDNIGNVTSVDALLKDRKLLTVALSAFQLESQINNTGIIRKLLSEDPTSKTSLAQQLIDPRYLRFAQTFAALRSDGGASLQNPNSVNSVLAGYQTNEYDKWVANTTNDSTVRQALYFQQTIQDTLDISDTGKLFSRFQQSSDVEQAVNDYKSGVKQVTSINDLLNNPKVLDVALAAFNIDPKTVTPDTLRRVLGEPTTSPVLNANAPSLATDPLASSDLRLAQFAISFNSLATDGGAAIQGSTSIDDTIARYQRNQFAKTLATNAPATITFDFGDQGSTTIKRLLKDFQTTSGISTSVNYYQNNIGGVSSVDDLVNDPRLLTVALGAFNLDATKVTSDVARQLLTNDPKGSATVQTAAETLLQTDPDVAAFVKTFSSLSAKGDGGFAAIGDLFKQFKQLTAVQSAVTYFQNNIGNVKSVADLTGDSRLLDVALGAFGLDPTAVSASTVSQLLTETPAQQAADPLVISDSRFAQFIQTFGSLNTDKGTQLQAQNAVAAITSAYQTNLFAQTLATNDPTTTAADFADGSITINKLAGDFAAGSGVSQSISYYQDHIGSVTSVADLVADPKLLKVALRAFNLDPTNLSANTIIDLLGGAPSADATALTQANPDVAKFVAAFGSLNSDDGVASGSATNIASITAAYQNNQFKQSIEAKTEVVNANPDLASSTIAPFTDPAGIAKIVDAFQNNQFVQKITSSVQNLTTTSSLGTISTNQILANATLSAVVRGALGLPDSLAALSVDQQTAALKRAGFDSAKLVDSSYLKTFINQFLGNAGLQQSNADPLTALFQPGTANDIPDPTTPPTPVDFSFLTGGSGGGSILDLFA